MKWGLTLAPIAYGATFVVSTVLSVDPRQSLWGLEDKHGTVTVLTTVSFFFVMRASLRTEEQVDRLINVILWGSVPVAIYATIQFLGLDPLTWTTDSVSPVFSTLGRSNFLGAYLAMLVPLTLARLVSAGDKWRSGALVLIQIIGVLMTQARAAWLGMTGGVVLFVAVLAYRWRPRRLLLTSIASLFLVGSLAVLVADPDLSPRTAGSVFAEMRTATVNSRIEIWTKTLSLIRERWLTGYGPETFATVIAARYGAGTPGQDAGLVLTDPHNLVLDHLVSVGVLGLAALASVVGVFFVAAIDTLRQGRNRRQDALFAAVLGSATTFLIQAQFNPDVIVLTVFFWLLMAIGTAAAGAMAPS